MQKGISMATAWVRQITSEVKRLGTRKASWYVFWKEPGGRLRKKSFGPTSKDKDAKRLAELKAVELRADLKLERYHDVRPARWDEFLAEFTSGHLARRAPSTRDAYSASLGHFERICKLKKARLEDIDSRTVEQFIDKRLREDGSKPDSTVSVSTVNKDLRAIKAALNKARRMGYIAAVPTIEFLREPQRLPPFITDAHFAQIFAHCHVAQRPQHHPRPEAWWKGLLVMDILTGWRIGELLALEWRDVNLDDGYATTRAGANKGKRDSIVWLHGIVREHMAGLRLTADPRELVFAWNGARRQLYDEFHRIQTAAGIDLECRIDRPHTCTASCRLYGFHDGRRAFATHNAALMSREALKVLMRHSSEQTTARYINYAEQIRPAAQRLHVPEVLRLPERKAE